MTHYLSPRCGDKDLCTWWSRRCCGSRSCGRLCCCRYYRCCGRLRCCCYIHTHTQTIVLRPLYRQAVLRPHSITPLVADL